MSLFAPPPAAALVTLTSLLLTRRASVSSPTLLPVAAYALHPITLISVALHWGAPRHLTEDALLAVCFWGCACGGRLRLALAFVSWAAFTVLSPLQGVCLAVPLARWAWRGGDVPIPREERDDGAAAACLALLAAAALVHTGGGISTVSLAALSPQLLDASNPLAPELSLFWYLLSSAFLRALPYYAGLVWAQAPLFALPVTARFWDAPDVASLLTLSLGATFDPSAAFTLSRVPLVAALALSTQQGRLTSTLPRKATLLWGGLLHFALVAGGPMKHLWLVRGGPANPNYAFNQQLVFAIAASSLIALLATSAVKEDKRLRKLRRTANSAASS